MKPTPDPATWKPLPGSCKDRFPFKLSVPSFIYPGTWSANADMLGPHVDEIELLFFESRPAGALPDPREIDTLTRISEDHSIRYNIHLPTDISPASPDRRLQIEALDALGRVLDRTAGLNPTSYTLHIPYDAPDRSETEIERWRGRAHRGLVELLETGISPRQVAVENIDYPFEWIGEVVRALDLAVCMDTGHLIQEKVDLYPFYRAHAEQIAIIHLNASRNGRDHLPLTHLGPAQNAAIKKILTNFSGTLSLEVFSYEYLVDCMAWMEGVKRGGIKAGRLGGWDAGRKKREERKLGRAEDQRGSVRTGDWQGAMGERRENKRLRGDYGE